MPSELEKLIVKIEYGNLFEKTANSIDNAFATFKFTKNSVEKYTEVGKLIVDFTRHLFNGLVPGEYPWQDVDSCIVYPIALDYLKISYPINTLTTIEKIMMTGTEGGVYKICKNLTHNMKEELYKMLVNSKIGDFMRDLTFEEEVKIAEEYLEKYGSMIPANMKVNPLILSINIRDVLLEHVLMLKRLRDIPENK